MKKILTKAIVIFLVFLIGAPPCVFAKTDDGKKSFKQEELDQLLAPIALYPDSLLAQIFMASTYPLEIVEAGRWSKANTKLTGDELSKALEKQGWDPSVKSLVNFPQVLDMMSEKLDWTQKMGDAFLAQQEEVMATVQILRGKAQEAGNLKSSDEQKVIVEKETIIIESASPQVVYVPTYNPTVVYGHWWYPSYPPYYYYPPGYVAGAALFSFGVGVAVGVAWGYAWGGCNWRRGNVNIDINRNINRNRHINRKKYRNKAGAGKGGRGDWKHNPQHRKGVSYRDKNTARQYDRGAAKNAQARENFRGRAEKGRQDIARGGADRVRNQPNAGKTDRAGSTQRANTGKADRAGSTQRTNTSKANRTPKKDSAFSNTSRGARTKSYSNRGHKSMSSGRSGGGISRGGGRGRR